MNDKKAERIIDYLKSRGGSINDAARALDIKLTTQLKQELVRLDDNLDRFRYAFRRYGDWLTLPTDKAASRDEQRVESLCLACNQRSDVLLGGLVSGRSKGCFNCRTKRRVNHSVRCSATGQTFDSIRAFSQHINQLNNYQALRHRLHSDSRIVIDEKEYVLLESEAF